MGERKESVLNFISKGMIISKMSIFTVRTTIKYRQGTATTIITGTATNDPSLFDPKKQKIIPSLFKKQKIIPRITASKLQEKF